MHQRGELGEAERLYRKALAADAGLAAAWFNLGLLLLGQGTSAQASESLRKACELDSSQASWQMALAQALREADRFVEAQRVLESVIRLEPGSASAHELLGVCLLAAGEPQAALEAGRRSVALAPESVSAASNVLLALNYVPHASAAEIFSEHLAWGKRYEGRASSRHENARVPDRRLRIGYVSPDFRWHPVSYFLEPVLDKRDRSALEVFAYSDTTREDDMTARLKGLVDGWRAVEALSDEALAEQVRSDGIDILVDLAGHTAGGRRMPLFAMKPAPVQASWIGYLNTTGLSAMDYRITDWQACPEGWERFHTEALVRLPNSQWCAPEVGRPVQRRHSRPLAFGALHNFSKVSGAVISLWSRVLVEVPGSRLVLLAPGIEEFQDRVSAAFAAKGVQAGRIEFQGRLPFDRYLALHEEIDVNLDAFPYTGGTTTCHSLWMGVPVVTLAGETVASRGGASALATVGLGELVARSEDEYVAIAARLASDRAQLERLRSSLRARVASSPLSDAARFTRDLEAAYRTMWRRWCASA